jgi:hypothetical protein
MEIATAEDLRKYFKYIVHRNTYGYYSRSTGSKTEDTEDYGYNKVHAYIRNPEPLASNSSLGYSNHLCSTPRSKENAVYKWEYCDDPEKIISAPIDDVVFVQEGDDDTHSATLLTIVEKLGLNPIILDHIQIFDVIFQSSPASHFYVNSDPSLIVNERSFGAHIEAFSKYIKAIDTDFSYWDWNTYISYYQKKEFNKNGIYVRPVKKLFCYNPILAKRQRDILKAAQKRRDKAIKTAPAQITAWHFEAFYQILKRTFTYNLGFTIAFSMQRSYRTKVWYANKILELVDLCNLFFKKHAYRDFPQFKSLVKVWKTTTNINKQTYSKKFIEWAEKEASIKPRPKNNEVHVYSPVSKPKLLEKFKASGLKWHNKKG